MRAWLMDLEWRDVDSEEIESMPDDAIIRAVANHYDGGVRAFKATCDYDEALT